MTQLIIPLWPTITRIDARGGRHYRVEGYPEPFPSVTTALSVINKPALVPWARNTALESVRQALESREGSQVAISREWIDTIITEAKARPELVRTEAADFGTQAHVLIDQLIQGLGPDIPPQFAPVVASFNAWRLGAGLEIRLTETMVFSDTHHYAGAMDALATREGALVALDWKTSNAVYPEYALQVAAYAKALEEMTGQPVTEAWAVRFGKTAPEFEARRVMDLEGCFQAFLAALHLWRAMRRELI